MNTVYLSLGTNKAADVIDLAKRFTVISHLMRNLDSCFRRYDKMKKNINDKARLYKNLKANLKKCIEYILADENIKLLDLSSDYLSEPVEMDSENWFLNKIIKIETNYSPEKLLEITQKIERKMGRQKAETVNFGTTERDIKIYLDRIIDIDILAFDNEIIKTSDLIIPHPKMHERLFVLLPLKEISKNWIHPILNNTVDELIENISQEYKFLKCEKII